MNKEQHNFFTLTLMFYVSPRKTRTAIDISCLKTWQDLLIFLVHLQHQYRYHIYSLCVCVYNMFTQLKSFTGKHSSWETLLFNKSECNVEQSIQISNSNLATVNQTRVSDQNFDWAKYHQWQGADNLQLWPMVRMKNLHLSKF